MLSPLNINNSHHLDGVIQATKANGKQYVTEQGKCTV